MTIETKRSNFLRRHTTWNQLYLMLAISCFNNLLTLFQHRVLSWFEGLVNYFPFLLCFHFEHITPC